MVETTGVFFISFADDASVASEGFDFRRLAFRLTEAVVNRPSRMGTFEQWWTRVETGVFSAEFKQLVSTIMMAVKAVHK